MPKERDLEYEAKLFGKKITREQYNKMSESYYKAHIKDKKYVRYRWPCNYYSNDRKTQQRVMNWYVKKLNAELLEDYLWRSRFFIRQWSQLRMCYFEDGSGAELVVNLRIYDKQTMKYLDTVGSVAELCHSHGYRFGWIVNDAVTKHFDVWNYDREDERNPYNDLTDYASIPESYVVEHSTPLYDDYRNYIHWH